MPSKTEYRLITAALPYVNFVPHLGHMAGSHLPADIFARYCRLRGYKTVFIGGTDENGTATETAAQSFNVKPKELCDFFYTIHEGIYKWFNISYDNFSRTSKKIHYQTTQEIFLEHHQNKFLEEKTIKVPFCTTCKRALADRYIEGNCPNCGYEHAKGDQCEKCSLLLEPNQLLNPKCTTCGNTTVEFQEKKHIFFRLDKCQKDLERWIILMKKKGQWRPQVTNLALAWIKEGLQPRDITRDLKWGVPVPLKEYKNSVLYCWYDAPIGYISSTKEWAQKIKKPNEWKKYWANKETKYYCFIGKDNIPFHTIFFPGLLLAEKHFNLPYNVIGLQYLNYERSKFSKSQRHGVFCDNLPEAGLEPDYWRFYLALIIPETKDTDFLWSDFQNKINAELIGNFGNFINRTLTFIYNKQQGIIPKPETYNKTDEKQIIKQVEKILDLYEKVELREALNEILHLSTMGNKLFDKAEVWKTNDQGTLYLCANLCKILGLLIQPFLPRTSKRILHMLNLKEETFKNITKFNFKGKINQPEILFKKLENKDIEILKEKTSQVRDYFQEKKPKDIKILDTPEETASMEPLVKDTIDYVTLEEFRKTKIRIGKITGVKDHPNADRLYLLNIDFGKEEPDRQIVAGLKQKYKKEELFGKQVAVIINLKPAMIKGIESNGMLLAAVDEENNVAILTPEKEVKNNAKVM